ncbi:MAG: sensor histidine kinase [Anaerolineae bacterium]
MNRLWVRLTLSHAALVLGSILLVAFVLGQVIELAVRREAARQVATRSGLVERIPELVARLKQRQEGRGDHQVMSGSVRVVLADEQGQVLYDWRGGEDRDLTLWERRLAVPIRVNGRVVAYVLPMPISAVGQEFAPILRALRRTVIVASATFAVGALIISLVLSESVTSPLRRLVVGARAIAAGDLSKRIEPCGPQETNDMAHAFNQMAAALQDAERRRREFTADIAHELRTPLSVLQGNLSAMLDEVYTPSKEEVAALYDEVLRLNRLVQDLAQLAQADSGQLRLALELVDVGKLLDRSVSLFRPAAEAKGVSLQPNWPEAIPPVTADPTRAGQVLDNLLSNALRHTPSGGQIEVGARPLDGYVEVWVADNGEGIASEDVRHVFRRLWRAEPSRSREHGGSGLGLAIAKRLVEAMGGTIGVESNRGQGARFWVRMPLVPARTAANGGRSDPR